jgi:hypothetical protein
MGKARRPLQTRGDARFARNMALRAVSAVGLLAWCLSSWQTQGVLGLLVQPAEVGFVACCFEKPDTPAGR